MWWIRQSIMLAIAQQTRIIRLPLNLINSISRINNAIASMEQRLERQPTPTEIAGEINMRAGQISSYLNEARKCSYLDEVINPDSGSTLLDLTVASQPAPDHMLLLDSGREEATKILRVLSKREEEVLILFYGLKGNQPLSLDTIARQFRLSRERIRQLKDCGLKKLRMKMHREKAAKGTRNI